MGKIIDINDIIAARKKRSENDPHDAALLDVVTSILPDSVKWLFIGFSKQPALASLKEAWNMLGYCVSQNGPNNSVVVTFDSDFRRLCVPEFANQEHETFLKVRLTPTSEAWVADTKLDQEGKDWELASLMAWSQSYPSIPTLFFLLQGALVKHVFDSQPTVLWRMSEQKPDGTYHMYFQIPNNVTGEHIDVSVEFDYLPLLLDHLAAELFRQNLQ